MFDLTGKKALVTGASGGIGEAVAKALHAQGATVGLHGTREEKLNALAAELGERTFVFPANLSDLDAVDALGKRAEEEMEGVDILVNNAGVTRFAEASDLDALTADDFEHIFSVNVTGTYQMTRAATPALQLARGCVVNISSHAGLSGIGSSIAYAASKGALNTMTLSLARALAPSPKVLLLDEPLSALDLKLRQAVRLELQQIQHQTGITFIFVTHDQEEALTMSDRIAVINGGQLQQVGSAQEIYEAPKNKFVADFIGETNLLDVNVTDLANGQGSCILPGGIQITCPAADGAHAGPGHLSVRPERIGIPAPDAGLVQGNATRHIYLGTDMHVEVTLTDGEKVTVRMQNSTQIQIPEVGQSVGLEFEPDAARLLVD